MFETLRDFATDPAPFSTNTVATLWTDPHLAQQMLRAHLDPDTDRASYRAATIDKTVDWIDQAVDLHGKTLCDLGCGPGLYAARFQARGARVVGMDLSASSLQYARSTAPSNGPVIDYVQADYTSGISVEDIDVLTMVSRDYSVLSPVERHALLVRAGAALRPGGHFVFDVHALSDMDGFVETTRIEHNLMNGFWSAAAYVGMHRSKRYPAERVTLDRYLIVEANRWWQVDNWLQYFTAESVQRELQDAGFRVEQTVGSLCGERLDRSSGTIGLVARWG